MNERERRALARIERHLAASDPRLARMFAAHRHPDQSNPILLLAVGLAAILLGSVTATVPLVLLGTLSAASALVVAGRRGGFARPAFG